MNYLTLKEDNLYVVQVGDNFYSLGKRYAFSKAQAIHYYNEIREQIYTILALGNIEEKEAAYKALINLKAYPLRIQ